MCAREPLVTVPTSLLCSSADKQQHQPHRDPYCPLGFTGLVLCHESSWSFSIGTCLFVKNLHGKHKEENAPIPQPCMAHGIKRVPFNATQGTFVWITCHTSVRRIVPGLFLVGNLWVWIESWAFLNYNYPLPNPHYFSWHRLWASYSAVCNLESRN